MESEDTSTAPADQEKVSEPTRANECFTDNIQEQHALQTQQFIQALPNMFGSISGGWAAAGGLTSARPWMFPGGQLPSWTATATGGQHGLPTTLSASSGSFSSAQHALPPQDAAVMEDDDVQHAAHMDDEDDENVAHMEDAEDEEEVEELLNAEPNKKLPRKLQPHQYSCNSPIQHKASKGGGAKRSSRGYTGPVWDHTKRLVDESLMDMFEGKDGFAVPKFTHVCTTVSIM